MHAAVSLSPAVKLDRKKALEPLALGACGSVNLKAVREGRSINEPDPDSSTVRSAAARQQAIARIQRLLPAIRQSQHHPAAHPCDAMLLCVIRAYAGTSGTRVDGCGRPMIRATLCFVCASFCSHLFPNRYA